MSSFRTRLAILGTCGALAVGAAISAPAAKADQYDFIAQLDSNGVYYHDIDGMIDDGKMTCSKMRNGVPLGSVIDWLMHDGGFPTQEAGIIVDAAASHMCPDTWPYIHAALHPSPPPPPPPPDGQPA